VLHFEHEIGPQTSNNMLQKELNLRSVQSVTVHAPRGS